MDQLIQNSEPWHHWRSKGIGASECAAVLGICPYRTPYALWAIKTGRAEENKENNLAMHRGNEYEPRIRAYHETMTGIDFPPALVQHETYPFIRASLDGYNVEKKIVLEIKYQGKENHEAAKKGIIRPHHIAQLQHQLLVTGAERADYCSFDGKTHHAVQVLPDVKYCKELLRALLHFWGLVETDTPPPLTEKDYQKVKDKSLNDLLKKWKKVSAKMGALEEEEATLRKDILSKVDHPRMIGSGVRIQKIERKGSVEYAKIPELVGVDLEKFRKNPVVSWRLDEIKKS